MISLAVDNSCLMTLKISSKIEYNLIILVSLWQMHFEIYKLLRKHWGCGLQYSMYFFLLLSVNFYNIKVYFYLPVKWMA